MILTVIILIVLIWTFYTGWRRGILGQIIYFLGYGLSFVLASRYYETLGEKLQLWIPYPEAALNQHLLFYQANAVLHLDRSFYAAMGFMLIMAIGWLVTHFIGTFFRSSGYGIISKVNRLCGGIINMIFGYIVIFLVLYVLTLLPINGIQLQLEQSQLAQWIIQNTPALSEWIYTWWITDMQN